MSDHSDSPEISRRKRAKEKKWVFLPEELWKELSFAADFQTKAFALTGEPESVSRNDWIEDALVWALAAYWRNKGGRPGDDKEFEARAKAFAKRLVNKEEERKRKPE